MPQTPIKKKVVLACTVGEEHQVGIKMVGDVFESHGWENYFLGAGTPTGELKKFLGEVGADILALSLSVYFNYSSFRKMVEEIHRDFPGLIILAGGPGI